MTAEAPLPWSGTRPGRPRLRVVSKVPDSRAAPPGRSHRRRKGDVDMTSHDAAHSSEIHDTTHSPRQPLRLQLTGEAGQAVLDGGWWPQSRDIEVELADLVDHFPADVGRVARALYSRPDWDTQPHSIRVARGRLKTGSFPRDNTDMMMLSMSAGRQIRLLVVPPGHPEGSRAMSLAADPTNRSTARQVLAVCSPEGGRGEVRDHWTDDGGSWWRHEEGPPSYRS